jgi:hypothetical protein
MLNRWEEVRTFCRQHDTDLYDVEALVLPRLHILKTSKSFLYSIYCTTVRSSDRHIPLPILYTSTKAGTKFNGSGPKNSGRIGVVPDGRRPWMDACAILESLE